MKSFFNEHSHITDPSAAGVYEGIIILFCLFYIFSFYLCMYTPRSDRAARFPDHKIIISKISQNQYFTALTFN